MQPSYLNFKIHQDYFATNSGAESSTHVDDGWHIVDGREMEDLKSSLQDSIESLDAKAHSTLFSSLGSHLYSWISKTSSHDESIIKKIDEISSILKLDEQAAAQVLELETIKQQVLTQKEKSDDHIYARVIRAVKGFIIESNHQAKNTKYVKAIEVLMRELYDSKDFSLRCLRRQAALETNPELRTAVLEFLVLLDEDQSKHSFLNPKSFYIELVKSLDIIGIQLLQSDCVSADLENFLYNILKARWLKNDLSSHAGGICNLFTQNYRTLELDSFKDDLVESNRRIHLQDAAELGKPKAAYLKQCLEGALGVKYYTIENIPMVSNEEIFSCGKTILRYRGGSPTVGVGYLNALGRVLTGGMVEDQIAPNFEALIKLMHKRGEALMFTVHQTACTQDAIEDESGRVKAIVECSRRNPNFLVVVQSLNPVDEAGYIVQKFSTMDFCSLKEHLLRTLESTESYSQTGILLPESIKGYCWEGLIDSIKEDLFATQQNFTQSDWLAFMTIFYALQKLIIKNELLRDHNIIATTDPCKDDLDRGGVKWLTEMLLLGVSTRQIDDPEFLRFVRAVFLGRPILVKKVGILDRWMAIAEIILDKLTDRKNFDKISNLVDCAQHDFKVSDLRFTRDSFHSYPFPNMAETQQHIDLFWKEMQNTYEELMPAEYFQTIYHKDAPQMRLSKDIERCDIFLDGQKLQRNQAIDMPLIEGFLKAKFPAFASDSKLNDYLKALFTQGVYTFATQTMTKKLSPKGCFYQNLKYEVYANSKQEEVILKARFILRSMDYQTLAINEEIEVEIHAPYDHNKPGRCIYTRVQG